MKLLIHVIGLLVALSVSLRAGFAQGFGEYGRVLGGIGTKGVGMGKPVTPERTVPQSGKSQSRVGEPSPGKLPSVLTVAVNNALIFSRSEDWADKVGETSIGEQVVPMLQASGSNGVWYMVKARSGVVGWIRASDLTPNSSKSQ